MAGCALAQRENKSHLSARFPLDPSWKHKEEPLDADLPYTITIMTRGRKNLALSFPPKKITAPLQPGNMHCCEGSHIFSRYAKKK